MCPRRQGQSAARNIPTSTAWSVRFSFAVAEFGEETESCPPQKDTARFTRLVRPLKWRSQAVVKKSHVVDIRVARLVSPRMVRHLRFGGQTRDAVSGNAPRRRERFSRVSEWLTILGQQMTVALVIKPDRVNFHLASSFVGQYEELRDSADLYETVGRQNLPHPVLMGVPHDEVQVLVFTGLLANQGVDTPAAVQPHVRARRAEPPQNLDDIRRCHRHSHVRLPVSPRGAGIRVRLNVRGRALAACRRAPLGVPGPPRTFLRPNPIEQPENEPDAFHDRGQRSRRYARKRSIVNRFG